MSILYIGGDYRDRDDGGGENKYVIDPISRRFGDLTTIILYK